MYNTWQMSRGWEKKAYRSRENPPENSFTSQTFFVKHSNTGSTMMDSFPSSA